MPNPTPSPEVVPFETMLDQLSKQLEFKSRKKLGLFMRSAIGKVLEAFHKPSQKNKTSKEVKFRVISSSRFKVQVELDVLVMNGRGLKKLCSVGLRKDSFRGIPDKSPKLTDIKDLPDLVSRQSIQIIDLKPEDKEAWVGTNYLKTRVKKCEDSDLVIDIQAE
jgi:hypothetical protein